jgi:hypothetical protein
MTPEQRLELDIKDFRRVYKGLELHGSLDAKGAMERLRHKEDG